MDTPAPSPPQPSRAPVWIFVAGMAATLLLGMFGMTLYYFMTHRPPQQAAVEDGGTASGGASVPALSDAPGAEGVPSLGPSADVTPPQPDMPLPELKNPITPGTPSALGVAGAVDRLDMPVALPKGMLPFLRGLDLLGANRALDAVPAFGQAIAANEENSDFYTARGACFVVAERMNESLPDLQRALKLNPNNILASRMARLAYLMLGDQLTASKFYGHGSTKDMDFLITEVGVGYGSRTSAQQHGYKQAVQDQQKTAAALQKLPTVAGMVANAYRSGEQKSVQALFALGVEQVSTGDYEAARRSFRDVIAKYPYDWTSRYYHARSLLETGDPELARRELTYVLCWKRFLPEAFATRAMCAAKQGDAKCAKADLDSATKLDAAKAAEAQGAVDQLLQQNASAVAPSDTALWDALGVAAKSIPSFDELAQIALKLRQSVNAKRLRWDETYQDRLHALCAAARAQPGNAGRLADAAEFLRDHNEVRGLQVETTGAVRQLRRQTGDTANWEIELAYTLVNEGLAAQSQHARCWASKSAILLHSYNKCEEAEQAAHATVRADPKLVAGHIALSDCHKEYAVRHREEAARLRTPKTGTRDVRVMDQQGRHVRTDTETYQIPPPAADLARAAECDRLAAINDQKEQACLNNALACAKGTPQEPYYQALMFFLRKDYAGSRPWLEKAVQDNPNDPKMRHGLANCLKHLGLEDEYIEEFARAINLQETTAEVWLKVAWNKLERNAWQAAGKALLRARQLDPADARIWAFTGTLAESGNKDAAEAEGCLRAALAQEEARARLNGTSYAASAAPAPLSPEDLGLSMMLRLKLARYAFASRPAQAADYYLATAAAERRMSDWGLAKGVYAAMLPFPDRGPKQPPGPPPLVAVLKNNRIYAGQALLNAGRGAEAAQHFAEANNFGNRLPAGGTAYLDFELEPQYMPFRVSSMPIYAKVLNAQALLQQGKKDEARVELQQVRYYLANRLQEQREMRDDPIPALYEKLAPAVGLR